MRRIVYKHVSLGIRPEQYTIVGEHLLASVGEVLGDAVRPEIAAAWSEVYWLFALQLVAEEARLYQQYQQANVDPFRPTRPNAWYAVSKKRRTSSPSSSNQQTVVLLQPSPLASTCRYSSTCPMEIGNRASTRCPPPLYGLACRSQGCGSGE
jgi:hypothetical protein